MMCHRYLPPVLIASLGFVILASLPIPAEEAAGKEKIEKLIKQMGSDDFAERRKATQALDAIGGPTLEALRKAAQSDDAELRSRAGELVKKIETRLIREKVLTSKRVHLVCKDTPVKDAVADFQKKSGYLFYLHDPDNKLKDRTVTLDTGETTFWHAFDQFCVKAGLVEATVDDLLKPRRGRPVPPPSYGDPIQKPVPIKKPGDAAPPAKERVQPAPPADGPRIQVGGKSIHPATRGLILLKDGKPQKLPTEDSGAVRIRALPPSPPIPGVDPTEGIDAPFVKQVALTLEVTPEPRLQFQSIRAVRIEKALDEKDQTLKPGRQLGAFDPTMWQMPLGGQQVHVCLMKGEKVAKALKELKGVLSAQVVSEPAPFITADNLARAAGKIFKGEEGGSIKVLDVKTDDKDGTTIQFEFERPPSIFPAQPIPVQPAPVQRAPVPVVPRPPAKDDTPARIRGGGGGFFALEDKGTVSSWTVQDDKGNVLPSRIVRIEQDDGHGSTLTLHCQPRKDQGPPAKLFFLGRKSVTIDIPFSLKGKMLLQPVGEA